MVVFDRGNQAEIDGAFVQQLRAFRRHVKAEIELWRALETIDERTRVQVPHRTEAHARHHRSRSKRPSRSIGSRPAARMLRRISSSGARRRPSTLPSSGDTASTSLAPTVSATCASLGPYNDQST